MKFKIITCIAMTLVLSNMACKKSFLNSPPLGELSKDQLAEKGGVETVIVGAYSVLNGQIDQASNAFNSPASNWSFGDVTSDDAYKGGGGTGDQNNIHKMETFTVDATSLDAQRKWMACFEGINRANEAIKLIKAATGYDDVLRAQRIAEMRFLRGHFYFDLKKIYNNVPYIDENTAKNDDYYVANDLSSAELWAKIEDDFKAGTTVLPLTQAQPARPTQFSAWAYLAKAYIFQKKWADAITATNEVITKGNYTLMPNFSDTFTPENDNGREIIFAVQHSINDGSPNSYNGSIGDRLFPIGGPYWPGAQYGFLRPSQNLVNSYKTTATGLPVGDNVDLTATDNVDPRIDHTLARQGIPFLDLPETYNTAWIRDLATYGPYSLKKRLVSPLSSHWLRVNPYTNDLNYYVIRYADVLLWRAEAAIETGDLETGRQFINQVRRRARDGRKVQKLTGGDAASYVISEYTAPFANQTAAVNALKMERRLEFALEGHRFFDLVRWGEAATVINNYLAVEKTKRSYLTVAAFVPGKNEYQPIPQNEIDLSKGALKQNPSY
ncbi:tetratricopeptide (TPR) repeat protein [Pedobacter sp. CAN_A7]|uniref:RagB/SusD family nutrient uptake outer membrane protein n=1 Tax=Pedobacter sp. CAN_A7 TaxID=2787722 RepID=UPI0018CBCD2F